MITVCGDKPRATVQHIETGVEYLLDTFVFLEEIQYVECSSLQGRTKKILSTISSILVYPRCSLDIV